MSTQLDFSLFPSAKVKHIRQTEITECGIACLAMISSFHGLTIDMAIMRRKFAPSNRGASLQSLMIIADKIGFATRALRVELEDLEAITLPAIIHWDLNHYVVLEKVNGKKALIHDPASGSSWIRLSDVSRHFTGIALEVEPTQSFETGNITQRLRLTNLWSNIRGLKRSAFQVIFLSVILQVYALVSPYYLQVAVDSALPQLNSSFIEVLALGFGLFAVLNGAATLLRSSVLLSIGSSFGYGLSSNVARKLFRLPIDWFSRRQVGDILSRFQSVIPIRKMLAEDAPSAVVDGALASLTLVMMFVYSGTLALVSLTALTIFASVRIILFYPQQAAQEAMIAAGGREQSVLIETIRGIKPLRLAGRESLRHSLWQGKLTDAVNGSIRYQRLVNWQSALQTTIFAIENICIIWLAVRLVIAGGFSTGMIFAYLAYKTQFLNSGASLITKAADFKMLSLHLNRISDIALSSEDPAFQTDTGNTAVLKGKIELRDVSYQYGSDDQPVLSGVNLTIECGESVAITGPSGGGKSTLVQIILGLAKPTSGQILIDDLPLQSFGYRSYHAQIAAVLQDDSIFGGTIGQNISLFDESADYALMHECARIAAINDDIESMPMGYETLVGEMGSALSGGQIQRLLLARALYRRPRILVMDEGTSSLDETKEREINAAVSAMGITRVIIAHRKETINSADRIVYLSHGTIV